MSSLRLDFSNSTFDSTRNVIPGHGLQISEIDDLGVTRVFVRFCECGRISHRFQHVFLARVGRFRWVPQETNLK